MANGKWIHWFVSNTKKEKLKIKLLDIILISKFEIEKRIKRGCLLIVLIDCACSPLALFFFLVQYGLKPN